MFKPAPHPVIDGVTITPAILDVIRHFQGADYVEGVGPQIQSTMHRLICMASDTPTDKVNEHRTITEEVYVLSSIYQAILTINQN